MFQMCPLYFQDFLERTRKNYNAELEPVDFKTSTEEARININSWVEKQTQGKISEVILPSPYPTRETDYMGAA